MIEEQVQKASEVRAAKKLSEERDTISIKSTSSSASDTQIQVVVSLDINEPPHEKTNNVVFE